MIELLDVEQNSEAWFQARCGLATASEFKSILAKGEGKTRRTYLLRLAGERVTGVPIERYENQHTQRGHEMEPQARNLYAFMHDAEPQPIGFIRNGDKGCSPDALLGDRGLLEIKTKLPHLLIELLLKGDFPAEHFAQCQGALWVSEREWLDIAVFWPGLPLFVKRQARDEKYIALLASAVKAFNDELAETVERVRRYAEPRAILKDSLVASIGAAA